MCDNQNMYFFGFVTSLFILLFLLWNPAKSQEFISLISSRNDDFCITNSLSAMYYTTSVGTPITDETSFLPGISFFCDFENYVNRKCIDYFKIGVWDLAYSINHENSLLLDLRWERLPVLDLPYKKSKNSLTFLTLAKLSGLEYFKIPLSLMGQEAHLLLCDREDVANANCYWFILQGWAQKFTALRKCRSGEITGTYPKGPCYDRIVQKDHPNEFPLYMNDNKWSHFIIERIEKKLYLKLYNKGKEEVILHYVEKDPEMFKMKYLIGHRKEEKTYCKVHTNNFMRSTVASEVIVDYAFSRSKNGFCISIFLNTCLYCSTTIIFLGENKTEAMFEKTIPTTNGVWEQHKILLDSSNNQFMYVKLKTKLSEELSPLGEEFWSIDNVRECHSEEYRITLKNQKNKIEECRLVAGDQSVKLVQVSEYAPEKSCPALRSIGSACISCDIFGQRREKKCEKLKICEQKNDSDRCYCAPGYTGPQCYQECNEGTFGYLCRQQCGFCEPYGKCNGVDGSCTCNFLFEGPTCHIPKKDHYLRNAPTVIANKADSCEIVWDARNYIGKTEPKYYLIEYTELSSAAVWWKEYGTVELLNKEGKASIEKLGASKRYAIRVLVSDEKNKIKNLQYQKLPFTICNTTCNPWNYDDIIIETTSDTVDVHLNLTGDKCLTSTYKYKFKDEHDQVLLQGTAQLQLRVSKLDAFKNYSIEFTSEFQTISKNFRTQEGVPSEVKHLELEESTASFLKIRWKEPEFPYGVIEKYKVVFRKTRRIACIKTVWAAYSEMDTVSNSVELNNLEAYSEYEVTVYAINRLNQGGGSPVYFRTRGIDHFEDSEGLGQVVITNQTAPKSAQITFDYINCENLLGPLNFRVKYRCVSEWCSNAEERYESLPSFRGTVDLKALQPYCIYKTDILVCRNEKCEVLEEMTLETKASVPNKLEEIIVTATGDAFIWIRWRPPYPPTGKIFQYRITTKCSNCHLDHEQPSLVNPKKCVIWPDYFCHKLEEKIYYGYEMSMTMEAANVENYKYVKIGKLDKILVQEHQSEKPNNLFAKWSPNNTIDLFWNHPNRTNGILQYFTLQITAYNKVLNAEFVPDKFNLTYHYRIADLPPAADLDIQIIAVNNRYLGVPAILKESSYPASPELVDPHIYVTNYTKTTISIALSLTQAVISKSYVQQHLFILVDDHPPEIKDPNLQKLEELMKLTLDFKLRVVAEVDLTKISSKHFNFTIGEGDATEDVDILGGNVANRPLQEARYYNVSVVMLNEYRRKYRHTVYSVNTLTQGDPQMTPPPPPERKNEEGGGSSGGNAAYALLLLLLLIPIVVGLYMKRRNIVFVRPTISLEKIVDSPFKHSPSLKDCEDETIPLELKESVVIADKPAMKIKPKLSIRKSTNPPNCPTELHSKPVKMADFEEYVKTSIESGELERQHALFPRGQTQPWQYGSTKVNKPKNRYNNLVAYDHSRVILEKINGDQYSDYINANYIHGYNVERAYIATQGPKPTTLSDFWRMIWQENVKHIVMLANVYEGGKKKVEQYWPNINEELTFEDIVVQYQSMELFANFEYRVFHVTKEDETRKIEQLHFTTWPDHGVPLYPQSLVPFLRKILKIPLSSTSPVVVHCSAGVGRTGTILLADISLRMAAKQGAVDMLNNLQKLREQRPNMVDNIEQYKLAHLVVLECLMGLRTSIPCDEDMDKAVQKLIRDGDYKVQMNYLRETEWQDQAMKSVGDFSEELPNYPEKNRIQEIFPENQGRIFLSRYPQYDETSSYINAVQVDGFRSPGRFFITQQPLPNTVGDFWRLVSERRVKVILSLNEVDPNDKTCCKFWPTADNPELQPYDFLLVKFRDVTELEYYDIFSLHVWIKNGQQKEKLEVEIVSFKRWPSKSPLPSCSEELLSFYEEADAISRGSANVIVTCFDGVTASGVYLALSFMIEQMKLEHDCDVCLAVRTIRHNRKQFVTEEKQFLFLYECAVKYINGFQSYANFQNQL